MRRSYRAMLRGLVPGCGNDVDHAAAEVVRHDLLRPARDPEEAGHGCLSAAKHRRVRLTKELAVSGHVIAVTVGVGDDQLDRLLVSSLQPLVDDVVHGGRDRDAARPRILHEDLLLAEDQVDERRFEVRAQRLAEDVQVLVVRVHLDGRLESARRSAADPRFRKCSALHAWPPFTDDRKQVLHIDHAVRIDIARTGDRRRGARPPGDDYLQQVLHVDELVPIDAGRALPGCVDRKQRDRRRESNDLPQQCAKNGARRGSRMDMSEPPRPSITGNRQGVNGESWPDSSRPASRGERRPAPRDPEAGIFTLSCSIMSTPIQDLMVKDIVTVTPDLTIEHVRFKMRHERIHALPVVDASGQPIGIVSASDLLDELAHGTPAHQIMTQTTRDHRRRHDCGGGRADDVDAAHPPSARRPMAIASWES